MLRIVTETVKRAAPATSPPTERVVAVLDLLAVSDAPVTSSAIAKQLGQSISTCAAVLAQLATAGYVERDADKRYRLGPGLLHLVGGLRRRYPLLGAADEELERLSDDVGYGVTLTRISRDHLTVVAAAGRDGQLTEGVRLGHRFPITPPYGLVARAWSGAEELSRWVDSAPAPLTPVERDRLQSAADEIRRHHYIVWNREPSTPAVLEAIRAALAELDDDPASVGARDQLARLGATLGQHPYMAADLDRDTTLPAGYLLAPVLRPDGCPGYQLELHLLEPAIGTRRLADVARRAVEACEHLATVLTGRPDAP